MSPLILIVYEYFLLMKKGCRYTAPTLTVVGQSLYKNISFFSVQIPACPPVPDRTGTT